MAVSRLDKMAEILGLPPGTMVPTLPALVMDVNSSLNGSADPMDTDNLRRVMMALEFRVMDWLMPENDIDRHIHAMVKACISLIREELRRRDVETTNDDRSDRHVEAVRRKMLVRAEAGKAKYGTTTERQDLTYTDWLRHAQEEAMDFAVYLEVLIQRKEPDAKDSR